jgi:hypothetical protein
MLLKEQINFIGGDGLGSPIDCIDHQYQRIRMGAG